MAKGMIWPPPKGPKKKKKGFGGGQTTPKPKREVEKLEANESNWRMLKS
jgi:hypothetical protein